MPTVDSPRDSEHRRLSVGRPVFGILDSCFAPEGLRMAPLVYIDNVKRKLGQLAIWSQIFAVD
jgi:hypothetical protein